MRIVRIVALYILVTLAIAAFFVHQQTLMSAEVLADAATRTMQR